MEQATEPKTKLFTFKVVLSNNQELIYKDLNEQEILKARAGMWTNGVLKKHNAMVTEIISPFIIANAYVIEQG